MVTSTPDISVVIGVFNGATKLHSTLDSICDQSGVDLEIIVVDDGSTDDTANLLRERASRDSRIKVLSQANSGLTSALITGCEKANAPFIARQDVGDISLPGRFRSQLDLLRSHTRLAMVSCGTRVISPEGFMLSEITQTSDELKAGLRATKIENLRGPSHHGATMFRVDLYRGVGGYRQQFRMAQDVDLWVRLAAEHEVASTEEVFYEAEFEPGSISAGRFEKQLAIGKLILESAELRKRNEDDKHVLQSVDELTSTALRTRPRKDEANYWMGMAIIRTDPSKSRPYFLAAIRSNLMHFKSIARLVQSFMMRRR